MIMLDHKARQAANLGRLWPCLTPTARKAYIARFDLPARIVLLARILAEFERGART